MMIRILQYLYQRRRSLYIIAAVCAVYVALIPYGIRIYNQRVEFDWDFNKTGNINSEEPFGAFYFKQYLEDKWRKPVYVEYDGLHDINKKYGKSKCNYIIFRTLSYYSYSGKDEMDECFDMVYDGNRIIMGKIDNDLLSALYIDYSHTTDFSIPDFSNKGYSPARHPVYLINGKKKHDGVKYFEMWADLLNFSLSAHRWQRLGNEDDNEEYDESTSYEYYYRKRDKGSMTPLMQDSDNDTYAIRRNLGRGSITVLGSYAFLSNYGVQTENNRIAVDYLLRECFDSSKPIVIVCNNLDRKDSELNDNEEYGNNNSMYSVLLNNPSSRIFLWLLLVALLLAVFVNSRRRQRAKNELEKPRNSSIVYAKHLATLYNNKTDYVDLLKIEQRVLLYRLRKDYRFDIRTKDFTHISQFASLVANSHKLNADDVRKVLLRLESLTTDSIVVSQKDHLACIKSLDGIFKNNK